MSPRAACRLETLGFTDVYDYSAGKSDWLAAEGPSAATGRPGNLARTRVPTCRLDDTIGTARLRAHQTGEDCCIVVSNTGVVLGILDHGALTDDEHALAPHSMQVGTTTVRANEDLRELARHMHARNFTKILVTDPDGRLLGLLRRDDVDTALDR